MALDTDFNREPYYDDYDPDKGYYRILFRPGFAVQTRELTQLQTTLQEQVSGSAVIYSVTVLWRSVVRSTLRPMFVISKCPGYPVLKHIGS